MASAPEDVAVSAMPGYLDQGITEAGPAIFEALPLPGVGVLWFVEIYRKQNE